MGQISSNLLKKAFATHSMPFFPLQVASHCMTFLLWLAQRSKFVCGQESDLCPMTYVFRLFISFCLSFFSFSYLLLQWLTFYWACFPFKNFQESIIKTGYFCHRVSSRSASQKILLWVFHSNFWAFSYIFQAPLSRLLWSGYHLKDLFLPQKLTIQCRWWQFGQSWWHQKWNKGQGHSQAVTGSMGVNGLNLLNK